jgi:hypothetical protein
MTTGHRCGRQQRCQLNGRHGSGGSALVAFDSLGDGRDRDGSMTLAFGGHSQCQNQSQESADRAGAEVTGRGYCTPSHAIGPRLHGAGTLAAAELVSVFMQKIAAIMNARSPEGKIDLSRRRWQRWGELHHRRVGVEAFLFLGGLCIKIAWSPMGPIRMKGIRLSCEAQTVDP